jgi:preprotein translocase subunit YajC
MKKGDTVTAMGVVGTLEQVKDKTVILKNVDGSKIEILKMAISEVQSQGQVEIEKETTK